MKPSIKETLESVYHEGGFNAMIQYYQESEKLSLEDATLKADEYCSGTKKVEVESDEEENKVKVDKELPHSNGTVGDYRFGTGEPTKEHTHADHHPEEAKKNTGGQE